MLTTLTTDVVYCLSASATRGRLLDRRRADGAPNAALTLLGAHVE
jgi:hypothetical protein